MSKLPIFEHFLCGGNIKPKLKCFFKLKFKPKMYLLNCHPAALVGHRIDALEGGSDFGREVLVGRLQRGDVVLQAEHVGLGVVGLVAQGGHLFSKLSY